MPSWEERGRSALSLFVWRVAVVATVKIRLDNWMLTGAVVAGIAVAIGALAMPRQKLPHVGDHWHARYLVVICGKPVPDLPSTGGPIHTQGDGLIHVEPKTSAEAGGHANLGRFFASAGVAFARDRIAFPTGQGYRDGDRCPDGATGRIRLLVNGRPHRAFERYVPADGDTIVVQFGP